jgi:glyoxylase-like metal-dependent hydrolase (beta-lactamase superfamily II)
VANGAALAVPPTPGDSLTMQPTDLIHHPDGVTAIDTHYLRPLMDAAHVVVRNGRAAFVDTGTGQSVPRLLAALDRLGLTRDAVDFVFLTHVHLDHAGGAGALLAALPAARLVVHPRGAPHMVDPAKLVAGSIAVYGEAEYRRLYGELTPVPAARVVAAADGERFTLGGSAFACLHTPGHALHHQCIVDLDTGCAFTGDTFGLSYREFDVGGRAFVVPTTSPTQFDPDQLTASIDRIVALQPPALYLTHYSRVTDIPRLAALLRRQLTAWVASGRRHADRPDRTARLAADLRELWLGELAAHGCALEEAAIEAVLGLDLGLNVAGMEAWLDRGARPVGRA